MSEHSELLTIDDPLLPWVRKVSVHSAEAHRWLLDSARRWARSEFIRREEERERVLRNYGTKSKRKGSDASQDYLAQRIRNHYGRQAAVFIEGWTRSAGEPPVDRIYVGLIRDDCTPDYLSMWTAVDEPQAGLQSISDIFELPEQFRLKRWPTTADRTRVKNRQEVLEAMQEMKGLTADQRRKLAQQGTGLQGGQLIVDEAQVTVDKFGNVMLPEPVYVPPPTTPLSQGDSFTITTRITMG